MSDSNAPQDSHEKNDIEELLDSAERLKAKGNEYFLQKRYDEAIQGYTQAIEVLSNSPLCDITTGRELLDLRDEYMKKERQRVYEIQNEKHVGGDGGEQNVEGAKSSTKMRPYEAPQSDFANELAVYHSNRAACKTKLMGKKDDQSIIISAGISYEAIIDDCDISLLHKPGYVKALLRRMNAYEQQEKYDDALLDAKEALSNETKNTTKMEIQRHVKRLEKLQHEKMERLKEETMGKLKDLGNSFLSNFGMSLDQFQANKDPNTGSYNISFNNKA